jgi:membrane-associated phospholipid phosphatase
MNAENTPFRIRMIAESFRRPYQVTLPMVLLVGMVPFYIFIAARVKQGPVHVPEIALDRLLPVVPAWALVYGALYMFLIVLPVFAVRDQEHLRRTVAAYLLCWVTAYIVFLTWPTVAPRPKALEGDGFAVWALRALYSSDPPYNCFPSLHVAHSFVSALTVYRLHRRVGIISIVIAALVAISTLFTKQHYVLDVVAGAGLALIGYWIFLRSYSRDRVPAIDRRMAVPMAFVATAAVAVMFLGYVIVYLLFGETMKLDP